MSRRHQAAVLALALLGCGRVVEQEHVDASSAGPTSATSSAAGGEGAGGTVASGTGGAAGVVVGGGDAGRGGSGGAGGSPMPHVIEIALAPEAPHRDVGTAQAIVNDVDGMLLHRFFGEELPVEVEVEDGQVVSFIAVFRAPGGEPIQSFRVTPDVTRIVGQFPPWTDGECAFDEPMGFTLQVPEVPGALFIDVQAAGSSRQRVVPPAVVEIDARGCEEQPTVEILATASDDADHIVSYQQLEVAYEPGGSASVQLALRDTGRRTIPVNVRSLQGATQIHGGADWYGARPGQIHVQEPALLLQVEAPPDQLTFAPAIAPSEGGRPVIRLYTSFPADAGVCSGGAFIHEGWSEAGLLFDAQGLRLPAPTDEGSWAWGTDGTVGDAVTQAWSPWADRGPPSPYPVVRWSLTEDPAGARWPAVLPVMPDDLPEGFVVPQQPVQWMSATHHDDDMFDGYAATVAEPWSGPGTSRTRWSRRCE